MSRLIAALGIALVVVTGPGAFAQKKPAPAPAPAAAPPASTDRSAPLYFYLADPEGSRVLLQTEFSLNNQDADARVLRRLYGVLAGLEQRGFRKNDRVSISDWDKKEKFVKCYIFLEDEGSGVKGKGTGARVWCSESGISEAAVSPSDDPKHVDKVVERFGFFLSKGKEGLKN